MFFGSHSGHRLKPVCEMRCSVGDRPFLHSCGYNIGNIQCEMLSCFHRVLQNLINILRQFCAHHMIIKDKTSIQLGNRFAFFNHLAHFILLSLFPGFSVII